MNYVRVCNSLQDSGILVPEEEVSQHITDYDKDWYRSVYTYNDSHLKTFKEKNSIAGIIDVEGSLLPFDFDSSENPDQAREDALELVSRLLAQGITEDQLNITFSGHKGYGVEVYLSQAFKPSEIKNMAKTLAGDLKTFDTKIYNASRVLRVPYTKHQETGLYKLPIKLSVLAELSTDKVKEMAKSLDAAVDWNSKIVDPNPEWLKSSEKPLKPVQTTMDLSDLDLSQKPKWMPACRYAILNGFFEAGNRSNALTSLAAVIKAQGMPKEVCHNMLKGAARLQAQRTGTVPFAKEEIWNNIVSVVYGENWQGKTFGCKDHEFLQQVCPVLGTSKCSATKHENVVRIEDVSNIFENYAVNIDKNTVKTGIKSVDTNLRLQTSSHAVIAGCSGVGKTTMILNILKNLNDAGSAGLFCSMDMGAPLIYQKLAQKVTGYTDKELYEVYKNKKRDEMKRIEQAIAQEFNNIRFDFRQGIDIDQLRENILETKHKVGSDLKLVVLDFINRIRGPYSDETANLSYIAPRLADLSNETETLIISLAQIARSKGGPATPITDSRVAKGSSAIEESATALLGMWRPGYNRGADDKYINIAAVKTRMGKEFTEALHFDGLTSTIRDLTHTEQVEYEEFVDRLEEEKETKKKSSFGDEW